MENFVTGRRRRLKPVTVLEVVCDAHREPVVVFRPVLDGLRIRLTGNQRALKQWRITEHSLNVDRYAVAPACRVCGPKGEWRYDKLMTLMQALEPGVYPVNQREMDVLISSPDRAKAYLQQRTLLS
jgi:hypothetical protein